MIELNLFSKLLKDTTATMILNQKTDSSLEYYLIGKTLVYTIITTGTCNGEIDKERVILNIDLKLLNLLIRKEFSFNLSVSDGKAVFTSEQKQNAIRLKPLCIENNNNSFLPLIDNVSEFIKILVSNEDSQKKELIYCDFDKIRILANLASKSKEMIQITREFACIEFTNTYIILKEPMESCAINGYTLNTLLNTGGEFYKFRTNLFFVDKTHKTFVIFNLMLPAPKVDTTLLTKGAVIESYKIDTKEIAAVILTLMNELDTVKMDFSNATLLMSNEMGESLVYNFSILQADSISLRKLKQNPGKSISTEMSTIILPKRVCSFFGFLKGELDVFIYRNKIIFRKNKLYIIFGR